MGLLEAWAAWWHRRGASQSRRLARCLGALPILAGAVVLNPLGAAVPAFAATGCWSPVSVATLNAAVAGGATSTIVAGSAGTHIYLAAMTAGMDTPTAGQTVALGTGVTPYNQLGQFKVDVGSTVVYWNFDYQGVDAGASNAVAFHNSGTATVNVWMTLTYSTASPSSALCSATVTGTVTANQGGAPWSVTPSGTWHVTVDNASLPVTCAQAGSACHVTVDNSALPVSCTGAGVCHVTVDGQPAVSCASGCMGTSASPAPVDVTSYDRGALGGGVPSTETEWVLLIGFGTLGLLMAAQLFTTVFRR